jgi:hypothetical protein
MMAINRELPMIATRAEWLVVRKQLLTKEKELTRRRDALNAERCRLLKVRIDPRRRLLFPRLTALGRQEDWKGAKRTGNRARSAAGSDGMNTRSERRSDMSHVCKPLCMRQQ